MKSLSFAVLLTLLGLVAFVGEPTRAFAAAPKAAAVTPRHDPPDMPFRAAPTPAATRSIAIAVSTNLHVGFDTDLCRIHTVWRGRGLNLYGPQYSFAKSPFISTFDGEVVWTMPPSYPWAVGKIPETGLLERPEKLGFREMTTTDWGNRTTTAIHHRCETVGSPAGIHESYGYELVGGTKALVRNFKFVQPLSGPLYYLAHAEEGDPIRIPNHDDAIIIQRKSDVLLVIARGPARGKWHAVSGNVEYPVERISETGMEKGNARMLVKRRETRLWGETSNNTGDHCSIVTAVLPSEAQALEALRLDAKKTDSEVEAAQRLTYRRDNNGLVKIFQPMPSVRPSVAGNAYFRVENFPVPKEAELLVTGMDFYTNGNLAVTTWVGDVFIIDGATGPLEKARYRRVARGLLEPMGVVANSKLPERSELMSIAQKSELTGVSVATESGKQSLGCYRGSADWDYSGHYNAFVYGPVMDRKGQPIVAMAGHAGRWDLKHMGWALRIRTDGTAEPIASGLREPNGIGTFGPERELFVTDNQGNWIAACKLNHIQQGRFYGHPSSKPAPESEYGKTTKFDPPAVWFPYKLVRSASGFVEIPDDRFGPFKGQLLVGDFQNALVTRVFLEKVNGEYQGAVWPMLKGFLSGVNRLAFGPDGNLYVGGCQRTWAAVAPLEAALERVSFTGKVPFEIREARARADGFELAFTQPVDPATAGNVESYDVGQYNYRYTSKYGSPELDHDGRENRSTPITVTKAEVSADRLSVRLRLEGWKTGYVTSVRGTDVKSAKGEGLWNPTFYYTLNQLPK